MRIDCPLCKKTLLDVPADFAARPFCSMRCKLADLGNWFDGTYRISTPYQGEEPEDLDAGDEVERRN